MGERYDYGGQNLIRKEYALTQLIFYTLDRKLAWISLERRLLGRCISPRGRLLEPDLVGEYVGGKSSCRGGGGGGGGEAVEYRSHRREGCRGKILLDRTVIGADLVIEEVIGAHIIGNKAIMGGSYERAYQSGAADLVREEAIRGSILPEPRREATNE